MSQDARDRSDPAAAQPEDERPLLGGLVDRSRATLGVYGEDLEPDELTRCLGCAPSHAHRRGEARSTRSSRPPWPRGAWLLREAGQAPVGPDALLERLLDRLPSDPRIWEALRARYEVHLCLGIFLEDWNRGFRLSPGLIQRLARLGFDLDLDIYGDLGEGEDPRPSARA